MWRWRVMRRCLIPDLYKGKVGVDKEEASHLMNSLDWATAVEEMKAAVQYLRDDGASKARRRRRPFMWARHRFLACLPTCLPAFLLLTSPICRRLAALASAWAARWPWPQPSTRASTARHPATARPR